MFYVFSIGPHIVLESFTYALLTLLSSFILNPPHRQKTLVAFMKDWVCDCGGFIVGRVTRVDNNQAMVKPYLELCTDNVLLSIQPLRELMERRVAVYV